MKKILLLVVIIILLVLFWYFTPLLGGIKKNICPDTWIINEMPGITLNIGEKNNKNSSHENKGYFLINGEHDLKNYNTTWLKFGCGIKPKTVY